MPDKTEKHQGPRTEEQGSVMLVGLRWRWTCGGEDLHSVPEAWADTGDPRADPSTHSYTFVRDRWESYKFQYLAGENQVRSSAGSTDIYRSTHCVPSVPLRQTTYRGRKLRR